MNRKREIPFAFTASDFERAVVAVNESIKSKNGSIVEIKAGTANGNAVGIIVVEEQV